MLPNEVDIRLEQLIASDTDISDHLLTMVDYARRCETITELGTRNAVSTVAWLAARPKSLRCHDLKRLPGVDFVEQFAKSMGVEFNFFEEDDITSDNVAESDLIFIDTMHTYRQLSCELHLHAHKAKKYIILHDVFTYGRTEQWHFQPCESSSVEATSKLDGELGTFISSLGEHKGLMPAIEKFLERNREWRVIDVHCFNNGFMVLGRRGVSGYPVDASKHFRQCMMKGEDS